MIEVNVLKDASEVIHYNNPNIPLYVKHRRLSKYANMEALCHWHEDIEYIRACEGHMSYYVNGEKITIWEKDALIVNSRQMHYGFSEDKTECLFDCILFQLSLLSPNKEITEKYFRPVAEHPHLPFIYLHSAVPEEMQIIQLFDEISRRCQGQESGFELMAVSLLHSAWSAIYCLLEQHLISLDSILDDNLLVQKHMVSFIYQNYTKKLSLADIANSGNVCRSKCCLIFKKYLNRSPMEFLNAYRLSVSMRLLTDTPMSITEIAFSCGFFSPSYYTELFQKYKGCSPGKYRAYRKYSPGSLEPANPQ